jgi:hypothetical protein
VSPSSPDVIHAVLGVRIQIPAEAVVPLLVGVAALLVLVFAGSALKDWKERAPGPASMFGLVVGSLCAIGAIYFLAKSVPNQIDPNSDGTGQLNHFDPPIGAFMTVLACAFFRMGGKYKISFWGGLLVGVVMLVKPFVLPVIVTYADSYGGGANGITSRSRGMTDPEHLEFIASGIVILITAFITGAKPVPPPRAYPLPGQYPPPPGQYPPPPYPPA